MFTKWTATLLLALPFLTSGISAFSPGTPGDATYYHPGETSCGPIHSDDDLIVALSPDVFALYPDACGRYIYVRGNNGRQIVVQVADKCPECMVYSVDLTSAGFLMLFGSLEVGRDRITWDWV